MTHQFDLKDLSKSRQQLTITSIDPTVLEKMEKKVISELSQQLKVKGFRPGNIPEGVVREQVEEQYIKMQTLQYAIPEVANAIMKEKEIRVVGEPQMSIESLDPLKVVIEYDLFPEAKVGDYKKISIKVEKKTATDAEVDEALKHVQERMTEYEKVDRKAKKGDRAEIDFDGKTPDGVPLENASSKNHPIVLGSNMLIPGFEDELVGMKAGEEKDFEITFPKDYHATTLAGKKAIFHVKVHQVEEAKLPEMDEDFVEKMTGKKQPLADWKKTVKEQIQAEHDAQVKRETEEQYYDELIKLTTAEIPQSMIDSEKQSILREMKQQILSRGLSYEHYLQAQGKTEEQLLESYDTQASDRIKLRMALQDISKQEQIEVSDVDVEERLNELLKHYPEKDAAQMKKQYQPGSEPYDALMYQIRMQKTLEKILPKV